MTIHSGSWRTGTIKTSQELQLKKKWNCVFLALHVLVVSGLCGPFLKLK